MTPPSEQDALNLAILRQPDLWRPLECAWNYMATNVGGHRLVADTRVPTIYYDACPDGGPTGAHGERTDDLLRCACGQRVELLHFAGGVRRHPLYSELNATLLGADGDELRRIARDRHASPSTVEARARAR